MTAADGDALRAKVADTNHQSRQRLSASGNPPEPPTPRCETCRDIKRRRAAALRVDDRQEAARMTAAMGVHQRRAH
ncbi:hypothetical protein [Streptomyces abikoensis]|uniref:hypothetical protein n=1 Tax=Streptomyces abikoensis TaxID=97398 RepID=UPI00167B2B28|nr:hypothetical protein [Streptomyces abikoensis]GGP66693.1 hypothetical protein GCM10010214_46160 [Streptomyces abikoensis]